MIASRRPGILQQEKPLSLPARGDLHDPRDSRSRAESHDGRGPFAGPERSEYPHEVGRGETHGPQPFQPERAHGRKRQQHRADEGELADLDADVERKQRGHELVARQAGGAEPGGETEAMQQPEGEGDDPRKADGQAVPAPLSAHDFGR